MFTTTVLLSLASVAFAEKPKKTPAQIAQEKVDDANNVHMQHSLGYLWVAFFVFFFLFHAIFFLVRYIRTVSSLNNDTQRYFAQPPNPYTWFKTNLQNAPLFRTRHHREFKMSSAINVGTLPSRLQTTLLLGYFGLNVGFCFWRIDYHGDYVTVAGVLLKRCGVLAVINMIPLFLLAGRNNPIINLTGISFDTMNLIHRWFGRIVVLEALAHVSAYIAETAHGKGWSKVGAELIAGEFKYTGLIGVVAFTFLLLQSPGAIRHAFYETFLTGHIIGAAVAVAGVWFHLKKRPQQLMLYGVVALWVMERSIRLVRLIVRNMGNGGTKADVEVLPGDALRVTVRMARPWTFRPGQHAYLYMPTIGLWTNHPFSVAWSDEEEDVNMSNMVADEKGLPLNRQDILEKHKTSMSFIIRRRTGFTESLYKKADLSAAGRFTTSAMVEGPYGKCRSLFPAICNMHILAIYFTTQSC
jgi:hypothetical protein